MARKRKTPEERRIARALSKKKWQQSIKGKASHGRSQEIYENTEAGIAARRRANKTQRGRRAAALTHQRALTQDTRPLLERIHRLQGGV